MDYVGRVFAVFLVIITFLGINITSYERILSNEAADCLELRAEEFLHRVCALEEIRSEEYGKFLEDLAVIPFAPYSVELSTGVETVMYDARVQTGEPDMHKFPSYACLERVRYSEELKAELNENGVVGLSDGDWVRVRITGGKPVKEYTCTQVVGR